MTDTLRPLSRTPITIGSGKGIVISIYTDLSHAISETSLLSYFTTIPTKLVKLVREKELTDCIDLVTAHLGVNDEQAIAILKAWQDLGGVR